MQMPRKALSMKQFFPKTKTLRNVMNISVRESLIFWNQLKFIRVLQTGIWILGSLIFIKKYEEAFTAWMKVKEFHRSEPKLKEFAVILKTMDWLKEVIRTSVAQFSFSIGLVSWMNPMMISCIILEALIFLPEITRWQKDLGTFTKRH